MQNNQIPTRYNSNGYTEGGKGLLFCVVFDINAKGYVAFITRRDQLQFRNPIHKALCTHTTKELAEQEAIDFIGQPWVTEKWNP